jgi:hypothetical protein
MTHDPRPMPWLVLWVLPALLLAGAAPVRDESAPSRDAIPTTPEQARFVRLDDTRGPELPAPEWAYRTLAEGPDEAGEWDRAVDYLAPDPYFSKYLAESQKVRLPYRPQPKKEMKHPAEYLHGRKNPSVSELLARQALRCEEPGVAASIARCLVRWDPAAARPVLPEVMKRCSEDDDYTREYLDLVMARAALGDRAALDDYAAWVRRLPTTATFNPWVCYGFEPMARYADHPSVAAAADWMFNDPKSTWVPWFRKASKEYDTKGALGMTRFGMLGVPGFRKAVLRALEDRTGGGKVETYPDGHQIIEFPSMRSARIEGSPDPAIPAEGVTGEFRACDLVAEFISRNRSGVPRCELNWPEAKRDAAVRNCAAFLRRYGDRMRVDWMSADDLTFAPLARPATAAQAERGEAIFSLEGQGNVRTVKLPSHPTPVRWAKSGDGSAWQAEEVFIDGRWRRFFGCTGPNRIGRVPADEVEFPAPEDQGWLRCAGPFDAQLELPRIAETDADGLPRWPDQAALPFALWLRNRTGPDQAVPAQSPARLRLWYTPEAVSPKGMLAPLARADADWDEVAPKPAARIACGKRVLGPAEEYAAARFDLRDCFDLGRPGYYRLRLTSDGAPGDHPEILFSVAPPANR